jgi:hypothetical protein
VWVSARRVRVRGGGVFDTVNRFLKNDNSQFLQTRTIKKRGTSNHTRNVVPTHTQAKMHSTSHAAHSHSVIASRSAYDCPGASAVVKNSGFSSGSYVALGTRSANNRASVDLPDPDGPATAITNGGIRAGFCVWSEVPSVVSGE